MSNRDLSAVRAAIESKRPPMDQQEVMLKIVSAFHDNDFSSLPQYFCDDIELNIYGAPGMAGSWRGMDQVLAATAANFQALSEQKAQVEALISEGSSSAMRLHETGRLQATGQAYEMNGIVWYTFEGLKVKRVDEFLDCKLL